MAPPAPALVLQVRQPLERPPKLHARPLGRPHALSVHAHAALGHRQRAPFARLHIHVHLCLAHHVRPPRGPAAERSHFKVRAIVHVLQHQVVRHHDRRTQLGPPQHHPRSVHATRPLLHHSAQVQRAWHDARAVHHMIIHCIPPRQQLVVHLERKRTAIQKHFVPKTAFFGYSALATIFNPKVLSTKRVRWNQMRTAFWQGHFLHRNVINAQ